MSPGCNGTPLALLIAMEPELQQAFDNTPLDASKRSRLEPYGELILRWRRQGRTYRRICELLAERFNVRMNCGALYRFLKRRSRPPKQQQGPELMPTAQGTGILEKPVSEQTPKPGKMSPEEFADQVARMKALKAQPVVAPVAKKRYEYDPDQPLILERKRNN